MKILLIRTIATEFNSKVKTYNAQGVGLATELSRLGHECGLVYFAKNGNEFTETIETDGFKIKVYHIGGKRISTNAIYDKKINSICREYDIIQPSECDQIASWLIYRKFPEKTIIYHGPYKSKFTKKYNLRSKIFDFIFLNKCNFKNVPVITKSYLAEEYLRNKGFKNITTIGVGLNPYFLEEKNETKDKNVEKLIENKKNSKYILYIGTISKRKNLKFILKLLDELVNKKNHKNYKLVIIGKKVPEEGKYYNDCWKFINSNKLNENVVYIESVEQKYLKEVYKCSDIFVLPTQYDIFGMVYLEAMYFGTPIISTYCGGTSLLIEDGKNGFIRDIDKYDEWIDTIINVLENKNLKEKISKEAETKIKENFLWSKIAVKFETEYKKILNIGKTSKKKFN